MIVIVNNEDSSIVE